MIVHCKRSRYDVYIGRPGKWGNPFTMALLPKLSRDEVIAKFREWLLAPEQTSLRKAARRELRGKVLGCWCAPKSCHGDVLEEVANSSCDEELANASS